MSGGDDFRYRDASGRVYFDQHQADPFGFGLIYTVDPVFGIASAAFSTANGVDYCRVVGGGTISKLGLASGHPAPEAPAASASLLHAFILVGVA